MGYLNCITEHLVSTSGKIQSSTTSAATGKCWDQSTAGYKSDRGHPHVVQC